jgi:hypothetical protein
MRVWEPKVVGQGEGGFGSPRLSGREKEGLGAQGWRAGTRREEVRRKEKGRRRRRREEEEQSTLPRTNNYIYQLPIVRPSGCYVSSSSSKW